MKLAIYKTEDGYTAFQKQRTEKGYDTVEVGHGFKTETPQGEQYIALNIEGLTDNKWIPRDRVEKMILLAFNVAGFDEKDAKKQVKIIIDSFK